MKNEIKYIILEESITSYNKDGGFFFNQYYSLNESISNNYDITATLSYTHDGQSYVNYLDSYIKFEDNNEYDGILVFKTEHDGIIQANLETTLTDKETGNVYTEYYIVDIPAMSAKDNTLMWIGLGVTIMIVGSLMAWLIIDIFKKRKGYK